MMNRDVKSTCSTGTVDPLVISPEQDLSDHTELVSVCERLAHIWTQRGQMESDLLISLKLDITKTSNISEALRVYSESASQRMHIILENAQRLFDEQRRISDRFSGLQE